MPQIDNTPTELVWRGYYAEDSHLGHPRWIGLIRWEIQRITETCSPQNCGEEHQFGSITALVRFYLGRLFSPEKLLKTPIIFILIALLLVSSGCVKAQIAIDVHENGTADVALALGLTSQAKALIGSQGENPSQIMSEALSDTSITASTRQWVEGDYEWMEGKISLPSLDALNKRMNSNQALVRSFSLVRERNLLQDRFVLDAVLEPMSDNITETDSEFSFDPSGMFEFRVLVRLPGKIVETNGVYDQDQSALAWIAASKSPTTIHAVSEVWNWVNIGIIGGGSVLVILLLIVGGVFLAAGLTKGKRKKAPQNVRRPSSPRMETPAKVEPASPAEKSVPPACLTTASKPDLLLQLQVRDLLEQVNLHILKNTGVIFVSPDELCLAWPDVAGPEGQREIVVRAGGDEEISVNDVLCPADRNEIQAALVKQLKQMKAM